MCGRYVIDIGRNIDLWQAIYDALAGPEGGPVSGEIRPGDTAPVICRSRSGKPAAFMMEWGWRLDDGRRLINIRSETAGEKAIFRESLRLRRCVVPASHYFEWERRGGEKTKYAIGPSDGSPLFMAGLYRTDGNRTTFAIMTREPAQNIAFIHDRMPVILSTEQAADWLDPSKDAQVSAYVPPVSCRRAEDGPEQLRMDMPGIG